MSHHSIAAFGNQDRSTSAIRDLSAWETRLGLVYTARKTEGLGTTLRPVLEKLRDALTTQHHDADHSRAGAIRVVVDEDAHRQTALTEVLGRRREAEGLEGEAGVGEGQHVRDE